MAIAALAAGDQCNPNLNTIETKSWKFNLLATLRTSGITVQENCNPAGFVKTGQDGS